MSYVFKPICVPLDWLDATFDAPSGNKQERPWGSDEIVKLSDRYLLRRREGRSRVFDRLDDLVDTATDRTIALVRSCPHSSQIMPSNRIQAKIENDALYDYSWGHTLNILQRELQMQYRSMSRLDIAADGPSFLEPFQAVGSGEISYGGRADYVLRYVHGKVKAAELGTRSANKFGRIYNKSRELALSGKTYIEKYWRERGAPADEDIHRVEIALKGIEIRRYFPEEQSPDFLHYLQSSGYRAKVFDSVARTFVRFRTGQSGDRSRDRKDLLHWDWSSITEEPIVSEPRARRVMDMGLNALKSHIRISWILHYTTGSRRHLSTAQEIAEAMGLSGWMSGKKSIWKREAEKLSAEGLRAGTLFDRLQDCDSFADEELRSQIKSKSKSNENQIANAHASRGRGNQRRSGRLVHRRR
jgi:hypothetical protein